MQKTTMMKVVSILLILIGVYRLISYFGGFADNAKWGAVGVAYSIIGILYLVLQVVAGILGILKKDNLKLCKKLALIIIILVVVEGVLNFVIINAIAEAAGAAEWGGIAGFITSVLSIIFGLLLPVLYLVGINKSAQNKD